ADPVRGRSGIGQVHDAGLSSAGHRHHRVVVIGVLPRPRLPADQVSIESDRRLWIGAHQFVPHKLPTHRFGHGASGKGRNYSRSYKRRAGPFGPARAPGLPGARNAAAALWWESKTRPTYSTSLSGCLTAKAADTADRARGVRGT